MACEGEPASSSSCLSIESTDEFLPRRSKFVQFLHEIGFLTLLKAPYDVRILLIQHTARSFAFGTSTLITLYLSALGFPDHIIGLFMTATLIGDLVISSVLSLFADTLGRRKILMVACASMCLSGLIFVLSDNIYVLFYSSIIGIISPSGKEVGPFRTIEESTVAHLTPDSMRSDVYSWYALFGRVGMALGTVFCGSLVEALHDREGWSNVGAYRVIYLVYSLMALFMFVASYYLSEECELESFRKRVRGVDDAISLLLQDVEEPQEVAPDDTLIAEEVVASKPRTTRIAEYLPTLSAHSRKLLLILLPLFFLDSFGAGLSGNGWLSYYFSRKFHVKEGSLGSILFSANVIAVGAALVAASISKRIGLVQTMLLTHIPSAMLLGLIPTAGNFQIAVLLFVIRAGTHEMDQAPRQAYVSSIVLKEERTTIMAIVGVVRTLSISTGPIVTGMFAEQGQMWISFELATAVKVLYDIGILLLFLGMKLESH
ncbi:MFS general substrate transporter [Lipomyces doorenjongii]|uniref:MFS general substrate transporter n=1 Tax=Lipomyces doorenjongii TaxID=383834 RepID=UPI0034CEAA2F